MPARQLIDFVQKNREAMLEDLKTVVSVHSGTYMPSGTSKVAEIVGDMLREMGAMVSFRPSTTYGSHLIAKIGPSTGEQVFVVGHLDTVFEGADNWDFSLSDGKAFGPGVTDMKSGVLVFLWALKALQAEGALNKRYVMLFNTDEEPGSPESREFIGGICEGSAYALVMEPAEPSGEILNGRKGVGIFFFDVQGISAHAGQEPEKGASAIDVAASLVKQLEGAADKPKGTTVNVGTITGGSAIYAVPAQCRLGVDVRVETPAEAGRLAADFKRIADALSAQRVTVQMSGSFHRPPMTSDATVERLVQRYQSAAKQVGIEVSATMSGAASDGNTLAGLGLPVLDGLGPVGGRAHSSEEYMEVDTFFERTAALAIMLAE